jgi:hypothetical protein
MLPVGSLSTRGGSPHFDPKPLSAKERLASHVQIKQVRMPGNGTAGRYAMDGLVDV